MTLVSPPFPLFFLPRLVQGARLSCATIGYPSAPKTIVVTLDRPLKGTITLTQEASNSAGDTSVLVDLVDSNNASAVTTGLDWAVRNKLVDSSFTCSALGGQFLDLTAKFGKLSVPATGNSR